MHPTIDPEEIRLAYERDPVGAEAEHGAQFRCDVEAFVTREMLQAAVGPGLLVAPPVPGGSGTSGSSIPVGVPRTP